MDAARPGGTATPTSQPVGSDLQDDHPSRREREYYLQFQNRALTPPKSATEPRNPRPGWERNPSHAPSLQ